MKTSEKVVLGAAVVAGAIGLTYLLTRPRQLGVVKFTGFRSEIVTSHNTTTRQSDNAQGTDFWYYPLIEVTPDVNGDFTITWSYINYVDNGLAYVSGPITSVYPGLQAGVPVTLELRDTRAGIPGGGGPGVRDTTRGEAIAYGDPEGLFDGLWHHFVSNISVDVYSPTGEAAHTTGTLDETFKSTGAQLAVSFAGFKTVIT